MIQNFEYLNIDELNNKLSEGYIICFYEIDDQNNNNENQSEASTEIKSNYNNQFVNNNNFQQ